MKAGILVSMPICGQPDSALTQSQRYFSCRNRLTLGRIYTVIGRDGGNVIVADDDGRDAHFNADRLQYSLEG